MSPNGPREKIPVRTEQPENPFEPTRLPAEAIRVGLPVEEEAAAERAADPEDARRKEEAERARRVKEFLLDVDKRLEAYGAERFFASVETLVEGARSSTKRLEKGWTKESSETVEKALSPIKKRFQPKVQEAFAEWMRESLADPSSPLRVMSTDWVIRKQLAKDTDRLATLTESPLSEAFERSRLLQDVVTRTKEIERALQVLQKKPTLDLEAAFKEYLLAETTRRWRAETERKPTMAEKLFGKRTSHPDDVLADVLKGLEPVYASKEDKFGIKESQRIRGKISDEELDAIRSGSSRPRQRFVPIKASLKTIEESLRGSFDADEDIRPLKIAGIKEYEDAYGPHPEADAVFDGLEGIFGRASCVANVQFKPEMNPKGHAFYSPNTHEIEVYEVPEEEMGTAKALAHEAGHAMRVEAYFPLRDAARFAVELQMSIERSGYCSQYSEHARLVYATPLAMAVSKAFEEGVSHYELERVIAMGGKAVRSMDMIEEWAEMVGFAVATPDMPTIMPEKFDMVRRYLEKYGVDIEEAREFVQEARLQKAGKAAEAA